MSGPAWWEWRARASKRTLKELAQKRRAFEHFDRSEAERTALAAQENKCAVCRSSLLEEQGNRGDCVSGKMKPVYVVHRVQPGRAGGKYVPGNVKLVCSPACHSAAEKESRERFPVQ